MSVNSNRSWSFSCVHAGQWECRGAGCCSSRSCSVSVWGHGSQPVRLLGAKPLQAHWPRTIQHFSRLRPALPESLRGEERGSRPMWIQQWLHTDVHHSLQHCPVCSSRPYTYSWSPSRAWRPQTRAHRPGPGRAAGVTTHCDQKWDWRMDTLSIGYDKFSVYTPAN